MTYEMIRQIYSDNRDEIDALWEEMEGDDDDQEEIIPLAEIVTEWCRRKNLPTT
jgi:hypothetical protein